MLSSARPIHGFSPKWEQVHLCPASINLSVVIPNNHLELWAVVCRLAIILRRKCCQWGQWEWLARKEALAYIYSLMPAEGPFENLSQNSWRKGTGFLGLKCTALKKNQYQGTQLKLITQPHLISVPWKVCDFKLKVLWLAFVNKNNVLSNWWCNYIICTAYQLECFQTQVSWKPNANCLKQ